MPIEFGGKEGVMKRVSAGQEENDAEDADHGSEKTACDIKGERRTKSHETFSFNELETSPDGGPKG